MYDPSGNPLVFAGLWDIHESEGSGLHSCTIITRPANASMTSLHTRMPVMLTPDQGLAWLKSDTEKPEDICNSDSVTAGFHAVSAAVNNARHQGEDLIRPLTA